MALWQGYPKSRQSRIHPSHASFRVPRRKFLKAAGLNFVLLQLLFLGLFCYLFGSIWQQDIHTHNMNVLFVDYDGGVVGTAIRDAYKTLQADTFPTLEERTSDQFPTVEMLREEVCKTHFWAALYISQGASARLASALPGGSAAATYNRSDVMAFIWNEARYSAVVDSAIEQSLQTLASEAHVAYVANNGTGALRTLNATSSAAISVFATPWQLVSLNIQPTTQGARLIYNTLVIILILIQEFFYLGTINGLFVQFKIYAKLYPHRIIAYRNMISLAYTFVGSLCVTGAIWAFRDGWNVNGNQFALTWAVLWLFAHQNFLWLDVFTIWSPPQYIPMCLITWIVFNVSSILVPFELSSRFYRWSYAMPAHEVYQVLTDIWSRGCNPQLYYALPILFTLEIVALFLGAMGVYRRCHYAVLAEEAQEAQFRERLEVAMASERKRDEERKQRGEASNNIQEEKTEGEELAEVIRKEDSKLLKMQTKESRACNFGPSFDLAFKENTSSESVSD